MPTLPTINIADQAKFDRVVAAFGSVENYRTWLRRQIIDEVTRVEVEEIANRRRQEMEAKVKETSDTLSTM